MRHSLWEQIQQELHDIENIDTLVLNKQMKSTTSKKNKPALSGIIQPSREASQKLEKEY